MRVLCRAVTKSKSDNDPDGRLGNPDSRMNYHEFAITQGHVIHVTH